MPEPTAPQVPDLDKLNSDPQTQQEFYLAQLQHAQETILWGYELLQDEAEIPSPFAPAQAAIIPEVAFEEEEPPKLPTKPDHLPEDLWAESKEVKEYQKEITAWTDRMAEKSKEAYQAHLASLKEKLAASARVHAVQHRFMLHSHTARTFLSSTLRDLLTQVWSHGDQESGVPHGPAVAQTLMLSELIRSPDGSSPDPEKAVGGPLSRIEGYLAALLQMFQQMTGGGGGGIIRP